jgi:hypothetical protein
MSNRFKKAVIDDMIAHNIQAPLQDHLLDLFESTMKSVATTLVREARFDTNDFATAKQRGCEGFTLFVKRACANSRETWHGTFERANQWLEIIGHLE